MKQEKWESVVGVLPVTNSKDYSARDKHQIVQASQGLYSERRRNE
jgi:hypothetical protein